MWGEARFVFHLIDEVRGMPQVSRHVVGARRTAQAQEQGWHRRIALAQSRSRQHRKSRGNPKQTSVSKRRHKASFSRFREKLNCTGLLSKVPWHLARSWRVRQDR